MSVGPPLGVEISLEEHLAARAVTVPAGPDVQDREGMVGPDDHRIGMLLEDLHRDASGAAVALEDELGAREVDIALVARADLLDRKTEGGRRETPADDQNSDMSMPPSTWSDTPVMYDARGEATKTTAAANSSGVPYRARGMTVRS